MSSNIVIKKIAFNEEVTIGLTGSKSESNRALILSALSQNKVCIANLSSAADTVTLNQILNEQADAEEINVGPAGTAMRFLTAYLSLKGKKVKLTGSDRMKQRPIGTLVNALISLGAQITYAEKEGYPPISVEGDFAQETAHILIRGDISSQFITALLLIASALPKGLQLEIVDELTSKPYVAMTLSMLAQCGIKHHWENDTITIAPQTFNSATLTIEPDWSAASYWYSMVALAKNAKIHLPHLKKDSLQGDSEIASLMALFGVQTSYQEDGIIIEKVYQEIKPQLLDFKECPDLAQTVVVCAALLNKEFSFTGLETLKIKETDRILALQTELAKIGVKLIETQADVYQLDCEEMFIPKEISIATYEDHRMAMAFAPMAMMIDKVNIEDADVVVKSYPHFWEDFKKLGFNID
jgi:3-phosphoshikimate 1-carboxyvinyltransferase